MLVIARRLLLLVVLMSAAACDRPAIDPSQSLVGAKNLPPARLLKREKIALYYHYDRPLKHQLSFELSPDNSWAAVVTEVGSNYREVSRQTFSLSADRADEIRRKLWRLRPDKLRGIEYETQPADCPPPPTDTSVDLAIGFIKEGTKPGVEDDQIGVFTLPDVRTCNSPKSVAAHKVVDDVINELPFNHLRSKFRYWPPLG